MNDIIIGSLIGVFGTILGCTITIVVQVILNRYNKKKETNNAILSLRISNYAKACEYAYIRAQICEKGNYILKFGPVSSNFLNECQKLGISENDLYKDFIAVFQLIAPKSIFDSYHEYLIKIEKGEVKSSQVRMDVLKILNLDNIIK